ncbi:metallophosphoesterase [Lacticaseibacillus nasuensis]|uniref:metallophosphoesterase n=1 Tax=Lacticaseibacillus nasuensis TaxID=944671 RepID=UPI0022450072|nr:metallophosphoesterase [Lacticaseibacillus nasuensis]MCX2456220.1 metallophosphoesterase [Lacticaseibacillus nasuensis]
MKIAVSTDNHFDVSHIDPQEAVSRQAAYLRAQHVAVYVNGGDTFNDFTQTLRYFQELQRLVGPQTQVRFIAGNHDLVKGISYAEAQSALSPLYLHEQTLTLPGTDTVIIGNNGWYDYTLAPAALRAHKTPADFEQWKQAYWIDRNIDSPVGDQAREARVLATTEHALQGAAGKRVIYVTHFVPTQQLMGAIPDKARWQMVTALMGSARLGELLERYQVADVVFGHLHRRDLPLTLDHTTYHHQPMGYGLDRLMEWDSPDWFEQWTKTLVWLTA